MPIDIWHPRSRSPMRSLDGGWSSDRAICISRKNIWPSDVTDDGEKIDEPCPRRDATIFCAHDARDPSDRDETRKIPLLARRSFFSPKELIFFRKIRVLESWERVPRSHGDHRSHRRRPNYYEKFVRFVSCILLAHHLATPNGASVSETGKRSKELGKRREFGRLESRPNRSEPLEMRSLGDSTSLHWTWSIDFAK